MHRDLRTSFELSMDGATQL